MRLYITKEQQHSPVFDVFGRVALAGLLDLGGTDVEADDLVEMGSEKGRGLSGAATDVEGEGARALWKVVLFAFVASCAIKGLLRF